ncbi:MAG: autotransporter outer membrane beta-barrel domain-containing protein [Gammaproteobacteria bacterium]|nr:autotransporter outer membrane beta-barrel domain-containing protein [Gammaproteobacteria bacterium]
MFNKFTILHAMNHKSMLAVLTALPITLLVLLLVSTPANALPPEPRPGPEPQPTVEPGSTQDALTPLSCTPASGTTGDDVMNCSGAVNGWILLKGGSDLVQLDGVTGSAIFWMDEKPGGDPATDGNDTFIAKNSEFFWVFMFGGDDVINIDHSNFNNAYGDTNPFHGGNAQRGNDTITVTNSTSRGWIVGGNDSDTITIRNSTVAFVASGYDDVYDTGTNPEYTPYDSDDTILLDNVIFTLDDYANRPEPTGAYGGKADDTITFINGGVVYLVLGGHGNDVITFNDGEIVEPCSYLDGETQKLSWCGIYGDVYYEAEPDPSTIPSTHGDDEIFLNDATIAGIELNGNHGSDLVQIKKPVILYSSTVTYTTRIDGGDDRSAADTFVDRLIFDEWTGDVNGADLLNWETIVFDNGAAISFNDSSLETGTEPGVDPNTSLPYGLIVRNGSSLNQYHDFQIDGNLYNYARVNTQDGNRPGTALTVTKNYVSDNGELHLDTYLNDASTSQSDHLVVQGDTSGNTTIYINNVGGPGGQTPTGPNDGILVVQVDGASDGTFVLGDPLPQAGGYIYTLVKGTDGNWRLQSTKEPAEVPEPTTILLIGSGLLGMAGYVRRKRSQV